MSNDSFVGKRNTTKKPRTVEEKLCTKCETVKPWQEFYLSAIQNDGLTRRCQNCTLKANDEQALRNKLRGSLAFLIDAGYTIFYDGEEVERPTERVWKNRGPKPKSRE